MNTTQVRLVQTIKGLKKVKYRNQLCTVLVLDGDLLAIETEEGKRHIVSTKVVTEV